MRTSYRLLVLFFAASVLVGCDRFGDEQGHAAPTPVDEPPARVETEVEIVGGSVKGSDGSAGTETREIEWDSLIPEDWRPEALMGDYDVENLSDDDPRAQELLDQLKALWNEAPVVPALEGQRVKLPGFVVPLEVDAKNIDQFLLVPYYGACIHVPPPPANQTVHVVTDEGNAFEGKLFDVVWVTGTMRVEHLSSELAEAGYRLEGASVVPYE